MLNSRTGLAVLVGFSFGVALVISGSGRPATAAAKDEEIVCTVPPVTCTIPSGTPLRSAVAGTWNVTVTRPSLGVVCAGLLHLSGADAALTGSWACSGSTGPVTGDLVAGRLRLNLAAPQPNFPAAVLLVDATVGADLSTVTGTGVGWSG